MNICLISGSHRSNSQSQRVMSEVAKLMMAQFSEIGVDTLDLSIDNIPLWAEEKWEEDSNLNNTWNKYSEKLKKADGFIFIVPEWGGMVPPLLKNLILMCENGELAHKPANIISISAGNGGSHPIGELRTSGYKNSFIIWLPDHVIIRNVTKFTFDQSNPDEKQLVGRIVYSTKFLVKIAEQLKAIKAEIEDLDNYGYGM